MKTSFAQLSDTFARSSKSFLDVNPSIQEKKTIPTRSSARRRGNMNKVESEFALMLEAQKRNGEILRYEFEGITLRWSGVCYTPDFVVFYDDRSNYKEQWHTTIKLIEIKGAFTKGKYERAIERFLHAKTYWLEFQFEMWQKAENGWKRKF